MIIMNMIEVKIMTMTTIMIEIMWTLIHGIKNDEET